MALEEYRRKRDFTKTPEPPPGRITAHEELSYLIQKHDATRLHYDFRLELDGVLLSWAVTKGPSLDPSDKRLAVRTEDHPLSYGTFEGTIPKGQYGGGTVMMWDEGTWEPKGDPHAGLKKGHLSFILHGGRLAGGWSLIRMHGDGRRENWLLIKEKDDKAQPGADAAGFLDHLAFSVVSGRTMEEIADKVPARQKKTKRAAVSRTKKVAGRALDKLMKAYPEAQLATLVDRPPEGDAWLHEIKFDGYRLLAFVSGGDVRLRTRNGKEWTEKFPSIVEALKVLKAKDAVLDLEAVVLDDEGKSSFQGLQNALGEGGQGRNIIAYAFDLLHLDGKDLTSSALIKRKEKLEKLLLKSKPGAALRYSEHVAGQGQDMIARSCSMGLEGIVSKKADAPYRAGREKSWLKSKCIKRQEFVIIGMSSARKGNRALGALYLGYYKGSRLHYAGKVGTGFAMSSARDMADRLKKLERKTPVLTRDEMAVVPPSELRDIYWVKPVLLCEVAFTEWTEEGRIRHPSFQGLREDKEARNVTREKAVKPEKVTKKQPDNVVLKGITITHPDRVISEAGQVTKGELAEYYAAIAPRILKDIAGRPLSLLRCPAGIGKECFYQRNPGRGLGPGVHPFHFRHKGKQYEYLYIEDAKGLLELVQMGSIEIHPWGALIDKIDYPDRLIFDLDPAPDVPFDAVKLAARDLRQRLRRHGLESDVKCTGGKGLHVTVPLARKDKWADVKAFAARVAKEMEMEAPDAYVATMSKARRKGRIFVDYFRNDYTATAIADYAVRARPGAPVAVPLDWAELDKLKAGNQFTMQDVLKRLKSRKSFRRCKPQLLPRGK